MGDESFQTDLQLYGPGAVRSPVPTPIEAQRYCRRLAKRHYENFSVGGLILPRGARQHVANVYAYCRWADDLADETVDGQDSLTLLDWWEEQLDACYAEQAGHGPIITDRPFTRKIEGRRETRPVNPPVISARIPRHPVFVALKETIVRFAIPRQPLADLLAAFRQDQTVTRYETFGDLLGYCAGSANPVGRIVLCLAKDACGNNSRGHNAVRQGRREARPGKSPSNSRTNTKCHSEERVELSDSICTGLQLANFWQDVARDFRKGRVYLPREDCRRFGVEEAELGGEQASDSFRELLTFEVDRAEQYLRAGLPLVGMMPRPWRLGIALFVHGGLSILDAIRRERYDVLKHRPTVSKAKKLQLIAGCWWRLRRGGF